MQLIYFYRVMNIPRMILHFCTELKLCLGLGGKYQFFYCYIQTANLKSGQLHLNNISVENLNLDGE